MHSYWQDLRWDCYTSFFAHLYQSYGPCFMPFPLSILRTNWQNFTKFYICILIDNIYVGIVTRHFWHICTRVMAHSYAPTIYFRSISWEQIVISSPNLIYAFILTKSTLGLSHITFCIFVPELWPLIYAKISFPFNILRTKNGQNFTKFYISMLELLHTIFVTFVTE